MAHLVTRSIAVVASSLLLSAALVGPAAARNGSSLGHGVKCTWVLVSSVGGVNTYKQVCRKGV